MNAVIAGELTAGNIGEPVVVESGGYFMQGGTAALLVAPAHHLGPPLKLTPMTISEDGLSATYVTTGKDFTEGGPWKFQLELLTAQSQTLTSPEGDVFIFHRLKES